MPISLPESSRKSTLSSPEAITELTKVVRAYIALASEKIDSVALSPEVDSLLRLAVIRITGQDSDKIVYTPVVQLTADSLAIILSDGFVHVLGQRDESYVLHLRSLAIDDSQRQPLVEGMQFDQLNPLLLVRAIDITTLPDYQLTFYVIEAAKAGPNEIQTYSSALLSQLPGNSFNW